MSKIIIVYSTTDGHTQKICLRLQQIIEQQDHRVKLVSMSDNQDVDLKLFDKIVVGASIRYGNHSPQVYAFIKRNEAILQSRPNAFFSVNVVARKPEKCETTTNPYIKKFLKKSSWRPQEIAVFAGMINYQKYNFMDRHLIRFIMLLTKGPTHAKTAVEFTDWEKVDAFGQRICQM
ncbi:MAG: menaquinone-dependent protoporphyrinogen IX dehydrogenase [Methylococcaceae bacterium]|nr:menaquinone-dependent protoporphyrinogen IX dehydrogenase [Methylococcaceae bacterium]